MTARGQVLLIAAFASLCAVSGAHAASLSAPTSKSGGGNLLAGRGSQPAGNSKALRGMQPLRGPQRYSKVENARPGVSPMDRWRQVARVGVRVGTWMGRHLTQSATQKALGDRINTKLVRGDVRGAAEDLAKLQHGKPQGLRDRARMGILGRRVFKAAITGLESRSAEGDVRGAREAIQSLNVQHTSRAMGLFRRLRANWATKTAFDNAVLVAKVLGRKAWEQVDADSLKLARDNLKFARTFDGAVKGGARWNPFGTTVSGRVRRAYGRLFKDAMKTAGRAADGKHGDPGEAELALKFAESVAAPGASIYEPWKGDRIIAKAKKNQVPALHYRAKQLMDGIDRRMDRETKKELRMRAALLLEESIHLLEEGAAGRVGWSTRRLGKSLRREMEIIKSWREDRQQKMAEIRKLLDEGDVERAHGALEEVMGTLEQLKATRAEAEKLRLFTILLRRAAEPPEAEETAQAAPAPDKPAELAAPTAAAN